MAKILVIDDRATNRDFLVTLLRYAGHTVLECDDGVTGLEIARRDRPDLIISDMVMPTMTGLEFVNALRSDVSIANIAIILYTAAFRIEEARALAQTIGIKNVLAKPSEPQVTLDTVHRALGLPAFAPGSVLPKRWARRVRKGIPTIRSSLVLLALACIVPTLLIIAGLIFYDFQRERARLVSDSIAAARSLAVDVDRDLSGVQAALRTLATSPDLASRNLEAFYRQATEAQKTQNADIVVLFDKTGQQHINTLRPFGAPLPRAGLPPQLLQVFETGNAVVSDVFVGRVAQKLVIGVAVPVHRDGAVIYGLNLGIRPERLKQILTEKGLPPSWIAAIFDSSGTIVARTHEMERFVGEKGSPVLIKRMTEVAEASLEAITLEGIPVLTVFSRSAASNWTVAIGIPSRELTDRLWRALWWVVLAVLLVLAGGLGLALTIGGRIARSVRALTAPALSLGSGEKVTVPPLHLKEADEVGDALVKTSMKLQLAQHQANHDPLTGLANRTLFTEFVNQQAALCSRTHRNFAVLYLDLDGFKSINDQHGHPAGDELLRSVAGRLKAAIRESDIAARLGGDEFAGVLFDTGMDGASTVAAKLVSNLAGSHQIGSLTLEVSVSIGVAVYPDSASSTEKLLHCADEALYKAKAGGKNRYVLFVIEVAC
jgi:diguanylate cyclase (GGDEF)-like protein